MKAMVSLLLATALAGPICLADAGKQAPSPRPKSKPASTVKASTAKQAAKPSSAVPPRPRRFGPTERDPVWEAAFAEARRLEAEARAQFRSGNLAEAEQVAHRAWQTSLGLTGEGQALPTIALLLGDIRLRQGRYEDALRYYLPTGQSTWRSGLNLDVALCYVRLGNYEAARRSYSDEAVLQYVPQDQRSEYHRSMPGMASPRALEASILFARGNESAMSGSHAEAISDFEAAGKLAPTNGLVAYCAGTSLVYLNRPAEATPFFRRAAQYGRGRIAQDAATRVAAFSRSQTPASQ